MRVGRCVVLFFLFALVARVFPQSTNNSPQSSECVWFVLAGGTREQMPLIPAFKVAGGKLYDVPIDCSDFDVPDTGYKKFEGEYFQPGRTFQVLFGGANAGTVVLNRADSEFGRGYGTYHGKAPIRGHISALATLGKPKAKSASSRKPPTAAQQAAAIDLAKKLFTKAGVAPQLLSKIKIENLTVSSFTPSPREKLLASFSIEDAEGNRHAVLFISDVQEDGLDPEFSWVHVTKTEAAVEVMGFVDQADLFDDGREEIIVEISYYENWQYIVLARTSRGDRWEKIFETGLLGCE